jgi:hypothetical protein
MSEWSFITGISDLDGCDLTETVVELLILFILLF